MKTYYPLAEERWVPPALVVVVGVVVIIAAVAVDVDSAVVFVIIFDGQFGLVVADSGGDAVGDVK